MGGQYRQDGTGAHLYAGHCGGGRAAGDGGEAVW